MPDESKANLKWYHILHFLLIMMQKLQKQYIPNTLHTGKLISAVNQPPLKVLKAYFNGKCVSDLNSSSKWSILSGSNLNI